MKSLKQLKEERIKKLRESRNYVGICEDGRCVVTCMGIHKIVGIRREPPHTVVLEVTCKDNPVHEFRLCGECIENLGELLKEAK